MTKRLIKYFLFLLTLSIPLHADLGKEDLFVIHATKVFPKDEMLRAGLKSKPFTDPIALKIYPDIRATVHFTIGDMVRPTVIGKTVYNWEDSTYAIVAPVETIVPQMINFNCYDCFTLGSVNIDKPCVSVIVPEEEASKLPTHHYEVWTYNPKVTKIRTVVEEVIRKKGGITIELLGNYDEDILHPIRFEGQEIEQRIFLEKLQKTFPHACFCGLRWIPCEGEGYLFGELEKRTFPLVDSLLSGTFPSKCKVTHLTSDELEQGVCKLKETLAKVERYVQMTPYPKSAKEEFRFKRASLISWINIFECELELNTSDHKTLYGATPQLWERVNTKRFNLNALKAEIKTFKRELPDLVDAACEHNAG